MLNNQGGCKAVFTVSPISFSLCVFFCVGVQRFAQARSRGLGGCMDETEGLGGVQFEYRVVAVCVSSEGNTHVRVKRVCRKQCGM